VQLKWEGYAGYIEINGTQYELKQCHWHSSSEHTIDGQRFDMEAHMLHESSDGKIAVVGEANVSARKSIFIYIFNYKEYFFLKKKKFIV
jgi:carbonic anhydrase